MGSPHVSVSPDEQLAAKATASQEGQHQKRASAQSRVQFPRFLSHQMGFISQTTLPVLDSAPATLRTLI